MKPGPGSIPRRSMAMGAAIVVSAALLVTFLMAGWGERAWQTAAGFIALSCLAVCLWAALIGERCGREVQQAADRLAAERRHRFGRP